MHTCCRGILLMNPLDRAIAIDDRVAFEQRRHRMSRGPKQASKPQSHEWHLALTMHFFKREHVDTCVSGSDVNGVVFHQGALYPWVVKRR